MFTYSKYDVVFGEFPKSDGSVQSGFRPGIIIQNNIGNKYSPTVIVMPLTSKLKSLKQPTHLLIKSSQENGLISDSVLFLISDNEFKCSWDMEILLYACSSFWAAKKISW